MNASTELQLPSVVKERTRALWQYLKLDSGIKIIDAQHCWLIALVLELEWVMNHEPEKIKELFNSILIELNGYTQDHFRVEEALMNNFGYSDSENHIKLHNNFLKLIEGTLMTHRGPTEAARIFNYLRQWIVTHIKLEDRKYFDFLGKRKLLTRANDFLEQYKLEQGIKGKLDLLEELTGSESDIYCTTPKIVNHISDLWNRFNLKVGIPIIDMQHIWLLKLFVDMDEAMNDSKLIRHSVLSKTLDAAIEYADTHFKTEEELFKIVQFEDAKRHLNIHKSFVSFVEKRRNELSNGEERAAMTIVGDLRSWLINHIAFEDKAIKAYYDQNKEEALQFSKEMLNSKKSGLTPSKIKLYQDVIAKEAK